MWLLPFLLLCVSFVFSIRIPAPVRDFAIAGNDDLIYIGAVLIAARPKALAGTTVMALVERKALPSAGENMASGGGVGGVRMLVVVLVVDCLVGCGSICCKASRFAARVH